MSVARCRWCGHQADGMVTARGLASPIYDCGSDACWNRSYDVVRDMMPRTWKLIAMSGRKRAPQAGPDLFDQLGEDRQ